MNRFKTAAVAILFLLVSGLAFAQAEPQDETKPRQDQQEAKPPKADKQDEGKPQDQMKPPKADKQEPGKDQPEEAKPSREEHGEKQNGEAAQGGEHARPAGKSAHIPDEKFRANFGREHTFTVTRVIHETTIVPGRTRFPYGGYNFVILDPWPAGWLVSDDCYVDYVDGDYFLFDVLHPGVRVALFVSL